MESSILKILKETYVEGVFHTHVSLCKPKGSYLFNREIFENFLNIHCQLMSDESNAGKFGIAESPQHVLPVIVDIDIKILDKDLEPSLQEKILRYGKDLEEHIYNKKHIIQIIEIFHSIFRQIIEDCNDTHLTCCLFEKKIYSVEKNGFTYYKNGFHLHFPYVFLTKTEHENYIIPRVKNAIKELEIFADLGIEDSSSTYDDGIIQKPWLIYGNRKEDSKPYLLTKVFDSEINEIDLEEAFKYYQIYDIKEQIIDIRNKVKFYLPRILSIIPYGRTPTELKYGLETYSKEKQLLKTKKNGIKQNLKTTVEENLKIAERILPLLAQFRAEEHDEWMTIGWVLFNIGEGCQEALDLWIDFSSRDEHNFDENECINRWDKMIKKDFTIGTLKFFAKTDNPDLYQQFVKEEGSKHIKASLEGSHHDIAKLLFAEYGTEFVCASVANKTWYQFTGHFWEEIEEGVFLRDRISSEIVEKYGKLGGEYFAKVATSDNDSSDEKSFQLRLKQVQKLIQQLKSTPFKKNVMIEAADVFYNPNFKYKLDTNPYIFPFRNGVYDLKINVFRSGRPEDYVSNHTPIDYVNYSPTDKKVQEIHDYLLKVFPDNSVRKYFLDTSSDIFVGGNFQKIVQFWTGEGDNAKSVTQTFFERMLGTMAIKFSTTLLTGKKTQTGGAGPELARAGGGVRLGVLEEPDNDEEINAGMFKSLSGNDTFWARDLFEKGKSTREIQPLFKLIFICVDEDTKVSLSSGVSFSIKNLKDNKNNLLSWDHKTNGLLNTKQHAFLDKGTQHCLTITLLDGKNITCTPNHKLLTYDNKWIEAKDISTETELKMGIDNVNCDDIFEDYKYSLNCGEFYFNFVNFEDKIRAMAFCRLLGYTLSDGSLNKTLYINNKIDCETILQDIELLTNKRPIITQYNNIYKIELPYDLSHAFIFSNEIQGVNIQMILPDFIFNENCPTFLIREFIASMFGKDCILPEFNKNTFGNIHLVFSKIEKHVENLEHYFNKLSRLLYDRFGIESKLCKQKYNVNNHEVNNVPKKYHIYLNINSIIKFCNKIGFRYCCHKSYRMIAIKSVIDYKKTIIDQNINIKKYLLETDLFKFCIQNKDKKYNQNKTTLPCYNMKVTNIKNVGKKHVYDINIDEPYSNFIANGIVTHNCNTLPRFKYADKAVWNRVRVIPFESTFVKAGQDCPETFEEQLYQKKFPMDPEFSKKIPGLVSAFAWVLLEHRKNILGKERFEPEKVRSATAMYKKQNDVYRQFIEERIIEDSRYIKIDELWDDFKIWFRNGFPGNSMPGKNDVKEYFTKLWNDPEPGIKWFGYRLRNEDDDIKDGIVIELDESDLIDYNNEVPL